MTDATQKIAYHILAYVAENPDAQDTLKGISEWWLSGHPGRPNEAAVKAAVASLVEDGLLLGPHEGTQTYKVNRRRLKEIEALLTRFRSPGASDA
jgi:hypothetical protein